MFFKLQGSELVYVYVCVFLGFVPILCAGASYGVVKLQNRKRRRLKILLESVQKQPGKDGKICVDKMVVREWLHANHRRLVKVKFGPEPALYIIDRKGETLRTFNFKDVDSVSIEESQVGLVKKILHIFNQESLHISMN